VDMVLAVDRMTPGAMSASDHQVADPGTVRIDCQDSPFCGFAELWLGK